MVIAYHFILSAYGFWLPNDPRGSWSQFVGAWEVFRYGGKATTTTDRRSLARDAHDVQMRLAAKRALKFKPVRFSGRQALAIAHGFAEAIKEAAYRFYACAILPDHAHLIIARHPDGHARMMKHLKSQASRRLASEGLHPLGAGQANTSPWAKGHWKVFIYTAGHLRQAIRYVEENPVKEGLPRQRWSFVTPLGVEGNDAAPDKSGG